MYEGRDWQHNFAPVILCVLNVALSTHLYCRYECLLNDRNEIRKSGTF